MCVLVLILLRQIFVLLLNYHVRFSLLLLEFGEVYFEDFTVVFYPYVKQEEIEERYVWLYLFYVIVVVTCTLLKLC